MQDRQAPLGVFVGRSAELGRVAEVIARVGSGTAVAGNHRRRTGRREESSGAALSGRARGRRRGCCRPSHQAEADLDFGLVDQLLRAAGRVSQLAGPAGGNEPPVSSFAMGAQVLDVVGVQPAAGSTAIFLDDLQWADRKSVEALTFMLRRLSVDPVLAVVTYRGPWERLDGPAQRMLSSVENRLHVPLGGLGPDEVASPAEERSGQSRGTMRWSGDCTRTPAVIRCTCRRC